MWSQLRFLSTLLHLFSLVGSSSISLNQFETYTDPGATATDGIDGSLTSSIVTTNGVNTLIAGSYIVTYNVTDATGNAATPVTRTVQVLPVNHGGGAGISPVMPVALAGSGGDAGAVLMMTVNGSSAPTVCVISPTVQLGFNGDPKKVTGYAISLRPDFQGASIYPHQSSIAYSLPAQTGSYTIYAELYSTTGHASPVMTSMIEYVLAPVVSAPSSVSTNSVRVGHPFTRNLKVGMSGDDVRELHKILNSQGFFVATRGNGSLGKESTYFGTTTARALIRFQESHREQVLTPLGLTSGTGFFMGTTRSSFNARVF